MKTATLLYLFLLTCFYTQGQDFSAYQKGVWKDGPFELPFRFLLPAKKDPTQKYPLIIFLHGAFEKGTDNERQLEIGGHFFLRDSIRENYPAFVLFPQCPETDSWAYFENRMDFTTGMATDWNFPFAKKPTVVTGALQKLMDSLLQKNNIDRSRIYIAGLSQGGMGVLDMVARYPDLFAAGLAICGAGEPATAKLFAGKVALWLFHGSSDEVVPVSFSQDYAKRLKRYGAVVKYSEYAGVGHTSWVQAFKEPELMRWLFSQHKK